MIYFDVIETETVDVLCGILEVILVTCRKIFFPNVIENIFFEILLPKITPITVGSMYRPPKQTNFLEILNMTFEKVDIDKGERYIRCDFHINMYHNNSYIVHDDNTISSKFLSHDVENYHQFCMMHGLKIVSTTFLLVCFVCLKQSTCETRENVFYFTLKGLFVLEIIKC